MLKKTAVVLSMVMVCAPVGAMAAQKLIVKDSGGTTNKFVVNDDGTGISAPDNGFVGIGTAAPISALHVVGSGQTFAQIKASSTTTDSALAGAGVLLTHNKGTAFPVSGDRLGYMNVGSMDDLVPTTNRFGGGFQFNAAGNWSVDRGVTPNVVHFPTVMYLRTAGASGAAQTRVTIDQAGNVGIGTITPTSPLQVVGLPVFANNAAAITGGLTVGAFYRTGADPDPVCVVH